MARLPTAKLRAAKMCSGIIGCGVRRSHHGNAIRQTSPTPRVATTAGCEKPSRWPSINAYTAPVRPTAFSAAPTTSMRAEDRCAANSSARQLGRQVQRDGQRHDVDPEDPAPVQRVDQHAAEQRTDHERRARPRRPGADGAGLGRAGEPGVDHRQRAGHQERGADALQAAGGDQHPAAGGHRAQHRRHREDDEAHPQHRQPAELIGDRPGDEDQRAEGQQVAVHHPLLQRQAAAELPADRRQCQVDHRAVQKCHERGQDRDRDERPVGNPRPRRQLGLMSPAWWLGSSCTASSGSDFAAGPSWAWIARWAARMAR